MKRILLSVLIATCSTSLERREGFCEAHCALDGLHGRYNDAEKACECYILEDYEALACSLKLPVKLKEPAKAQDSAY